MPFSPRLAGFASVALLALSPVPGLAQTAGQAPKARQNAAPAGQQAQPQPQPQSAPVVVELKAEPSQPEWTKVCGQDQATKAETCYTTRDFVTDKEQRIVAVALYDAKGKAPQKILRILTPLGFLVPPGIRMVVDKGQPVAGRYTACLPQGCFAEAAVKDDFVAALKKGSALNVSARNQVGKEVTFAVPVDGFGKAFDGPPIDPKVLAERQKQMQDELQRRSEELRSRQTGTPGNPAQTPAADAGASQPKN